MSRIKDEKKRFIYRKNIYLLRSNFFGKKEEKLCKNIKNNNKIRD